MSLEKDTMEPCTTVPQLEVLHMEKDGHGPDTAMHVGLKKVLTDAMPVARLGEICPGFGVFTCHRAAHWHT